MEYMAICSDITPPEAAQALRTKHLMAHLKYVESILEKIQVAGPLAESSEQPYSASCFIYEADTLEEAQQLLRDDPYCQAGLYADTLWRQFSPKAGHWVGGKNW